MNAPLNSDSQVYSAADPGRSTPPSTYSPSVPISVYRELATELKTTQTTLDALTQQNQQLLRQNTLLKTEIQRFLQSAEQLGHFAGVMPLETTASPPPPTTIVPPRSTAAPTDLFQPPLPTPEPQSVDMMAFAAESQTAPPAPPPAEAPPRRRERPTSPRTSSAIVPHAKKKRDRGHAADPSKYRLFTEQSDEGRPLSKVASRSDLGNLWLATTILLVVVSAFGAGFLIMRPLLNR